MSRRGLSLVEVTISMVVISVMLVAGLRLVGATGSTSRFVEERTIGRQLVEAMLADISAQPYEDPDDTPIFGVEEDADAAVDGVNWIRFDDVDDYHALVAPAGWDRHGEPLVIREGWTVTVSVAWVDAMDPETEVGEDSGLKRVDVAALRDGRTVATASMLAGREGRDRRAEVPGSVDILEPLARMRVKPRRAPVPMTLVVDASLSRDPVGQGLSFRWLINGVEVSQDEMANHVINTPGVKELTLVVRDALGRASSTTMFVRADEP
ncbi:MAG: PKD domain-containing protein [Planctomycetota bacterium]|jgi:prepilin-type N-terminal cleavage/methylation domain-containing protein